MFSFIRLGFTRQQKKSTRLSGLIIMEGQTELQFLASTGAPDECSNQEVRSPHGPASPKVWFYNYFPKGIDNETE